MSDTDATNGAFVRTESTETILEEVTLEQELHSLGQIADLQVRERTLKQLSTKHGVGLTVLRSELNKVCKQLLKGAQAENSKANVCEHPQWQGKSLIGGYCISNTDLIKTSGDVGEPICAPIFPIALIHRKSKEGTIKTDSNLLVEFEDRLGEIQEMEIPHSWLHARGDELCTGLADRSFRIIAGKEKELQRFLSLCQPDKTIIGTKSPGWIDDSHYALLDGTIISASDDESQGYRFLGAPSDARGVCRGGTLSGWQEEVSILCRKNSRLLFAVSAAFAAALLDPLDQESGGVNFYSQSSDGKTTALRPAASVWGYHRDFIKSARSTDNGFEGAAELHKDTVFLIDELHSADPKTIQSVIYLLANEKGKQRLEKNGDPRKVKNWRTIFQFTGESSIASYVKSAGLNLKAGAELRCLDIPANTGRFGIFEDLHGYSRGDKLSDAIKVACKQNYGHAGPAFVKHLCLESWEDLKEKFEDFFVKFDKEHVDPAASPQVIRAARRVALIAFAGELASEFGITLWEKGEARCAASTIFNEWIKSRGGNQQSQEKRVLLSQVRLFFEQYGSSRFQDPSKVDDKSYVQAGYIDGDEYYWVFSEVFKSQILEGFEFEWAKERLKEEGILVDYQLTRPYKANRKQVRMYKLDLNDKAANDTETPLVIKSIGTVTAS